MKYLNIKLLIVLLTLAVAIPPAWADVTDVITANDLAATSTTPVNFSGLTKTSAAVYAGITGKTASGAIRFRVGSETEICTTTSGGKIKSVTIVFNSNTTANRKVDIYGKNTAYSVNQVYSTSTRGTLIGTASYSNGETQVVTASTGYEYIALRPQGTTGTYESFIDRIEIVWGTPELEMSTGSLTINDSGSGNTFTVTGSNLIDNVGVNQNPANNDFSLSLSGSGAQSWGFNRDSNDDVNGTVTVNYTGRDLTATTTIEAATDKDASGTDIVSSTTVTYQPNIYIVGDYQDGNNWGFTNGILMDYANGEYSKTITIENSGACIMFARTTGQNYNWNDDRRFFGAKSGSDWVYGTDNSNNLVMYGSGNNNQYYPIKFYEPGNYTITINAAAKTFTVTKRLPQVATPEISPVSGNFEQPQTVSISCATTGATIYYTTDGTTPTANSTQYTAPFTVNETTTVKAIAVMNGMEDSEVAEATYTKVEVITGTVSPTTLTMNTEVGTPVTATVTITNTGNTAFTPTQTLSGDNGFTATTAGQVPVGGSQTVTVTYNPTAAGIQTATLAVNINNTVTAVNITGIATMPGVATQTTLRALAADEIYLPDSRMGERVELDDTLIGVYYIPKGNILVARDNYKSDHKWYQDENDAFFTGLKNSGYDYNIYQYSRFFKQNNWVALHFSENVNGQNYEGKILTGVSGTLNVTHSFDIDLDNPQATIIGSASDEDLELNDFNVAFFDIHDQGRIYNDNLRNAEPWWAMLGKPNEMVTLNWAMLEQDASTGKYYFTTHPRDTIYDETDGSIANVINLWALKGSVEVKFDLYPEQDINVIVGEAGSTNIGRPFVIGNMHDEVVGLIKTVARTVKSPQWAPGRINNTTPDPYFGIESKDWDISYEFYPVDAPSSNYDPSTSVKTVNVDRTPVAKVYFNLSGQSSSKPFDGINIVKIIYSDGSSSVTKQLIK